MASYALQSPADVLRALGSGPEGLSENEMLERRTTYGLKYDRERGEALR